MGRFEGKVALVTGATLNEFGVGIGGASAIAFARQGARVIVGDLAQAGGGEPLAELIRSEGGDAAATSLDQRDPDSCTAFVDFAVRTYGQVDILVNNAALNSDRDTDVLNTDIDTWNMVMEINARGPFLLIKNALPHMLARQSGAIVNISSGAALAGDTMHVALGPSKAAVNTLTSYVATMYGRSGIRCNAICPGLTVSAKAKEILPPAMLEIFRKHTLTPYLGEPEHLANAILFLASDEAAFMNGTVMSVDGGLLQHQTYTADLAALMEQAGSKRA